MGELSAIFNSPFIVPVAGCVMIATISVAGIWSGVRNREIRSHERLAMIAQGLQPEPERDPESLKPVPVSGTQGGSQVPGWPLQPSDGGKARRAGMVLLSIGMGVIGFFFLLAIVTRTEEVLAGSAAGIIPLAIGIGFLADARMKRRDYERWLDTIFPHLGAYGPGMMSQAPPAAGLGVGTGGPMTSRPAGMSAAQASDWRPLH